MASNTKNMVIELVQQVPVKMRTIVADNLFSSVNPLTEQKIRETVEDQLKEEVIEECSSPWNIRLVVTKKERQEF